MPSATAVPLIVFAGLPGVGKTTIPRLVAHRLHAALIRIDAIEAAVVSCGLASAPVGPIGYVVAHQMTAGCLAVGTPVVIDAVNPVSDARVGWRALVATPRTRLVLVEVVLGNEVEHRRRVEARRSDLPGLVVPAWTDVQNSDYLSWDVRRDGERILVDGADAQLALDRILAAAGG